MLKNNKGQALIESVFLLPISILFFIYVIQVLMYFSVEISIDDAIENFLLCKIQKSNTCEKKIHSHLAHLKLKNIFFKYSKKNNEHKLDFKATALNIFTVNKTRSLNYETRID